MMYANNSNPLDPDKASTRAPPVNSTTTLMADEVCVLREKKKS